MEVRQMMGIISPRLTEAQKRVKELEDEMEVLRQIDKQKLVARKEEEWAQMLRDREEDIKLAKQRIEDDLNAFRQEKQYERNKVADQFKRDTDKVDKQMAEKREELARADRILAQRKAEVAKAEEDRDLAIAAAERIKKRNRTVLEQIEGLGMS